MSIASEITRLQGVKSDILTAIADKGVTVPTGSALDDCPDLIASIPTGGGGISLSDYFENVPVYWDNQYNTYSYFNCISVFDNSDLVIKGKFYSPVQCDDILFNCGSSTSFSDPGIKINFGPPTWLSNGSNVNLSPGLEPSGIIEVEIDGTNFKINGNTYTGGYATTNISYVWTMPARQGNYAVTAYSKAALINLRFIKKSTGIVLEEFIGAKRKSDGANGVMQASRCGFYTDANIKRYDNIL